jgi:hypothetical protein
MASSEEKKSETVAVSNKDKGDLAMNNRPKKRTALSLHDDRDLEGQMKYQDMKVDHLLCLVYIG